jgi:hypothetical protein
MTGHVPLSLARKGLLIGALVLSVACGGAPAATSTASPIVPTFLATPTRSGATQTATTPPVPTVSPTPPSAATMLLARATTDNYKACFNAEPLIRETRTWLQIREIRAVGEVYQPAEEIRGSAEWAIGPWPEDGLLMASDDGTSARLRVTVLSDQSSVTTVDYRVDAAEWGPLITLAEPASLADEPVVLLLQLAVEGETVAGATAVYRHEEAIFGAREPMQPIHHCSPQRDGTAMEWNGPGGRWWIEGEMTPLDWE